jgi:uncharacterized RDD family membrane protein YckC
MYTIIGGDGKEYGPASPTQVRAWIASGRANFETQAKLLGTDEWKRLGDYPEFSEADEPPVIDPAAAGAHGSELASRGRRLGAALIDYILLNLCVTPLALTVPRTALSAAMSSGDLSGILSAPGMIVGSALSGFAIFVLLIAQISLLSFRGQTLGKALFSIRIVRLADDSDPGFGRAWLRRSLPRWIIFVIIPYFGAILCVLESLSIFREDRRCLHDQMAGTKVVNARRSEVSPASP